jgi:hypothetical protein
VTESLRCFHLWPNGLTDTGDDWVATESWTSDGRAVQELARRTGRAWFHTFLDPIEARLGHASWPWSRDRPPNGSR